MCVTCVYFYLDQVLDLDHYASRLAETFEVTRKGKSAFVVHFSKSESVTLEYWDDDEPTIGLLDHFDQSNQEKTLFVKPEYLVPLIEWHVENLGALPDHILGSSNPYYEEFRSAYVPWVDVGP